VQEQTKWLENLVAALREAKGASVVARGCVAAPLPCMRWACDERCLGEMLASPLSYPSRWRKRRSGIGGRRCGSW